MADISPELIEFLDINKIEFQRHDHEPVFTCSEADAELGALSGAPTKNLFLRDDKGRRHLLLTTTSSKEVDLKKLSLSLGIKGLSFASPERLKKYLGVDAGAVTLLGLFNDKDAQVEFCIDAELWSQDSIHCHPLVNNSTFIVSRESIEKFLRLTGHKLQIIEVPTR